MLDKIRLKLRMNSSISNGIMTFNVLHKVTSGIMWHRFGSIIVDLIIIKVTCSKVSMLLIFNDHIMQYYTCHHNVLQSFKVEKTCRLAHNCKSRLKYSKCTFDILSSRLLCGSKILSFTVLWLEFRRVLFDLTFNVLHKVTSGIMWHRFGSIIVDLIIIKVTDRKSVV